MSKRQAASADEILGELQEKTADKRASDREERDYQLANADIAKIDAIVLSEDVQKGGKIRLERRGPFDQVYQYICYIPAEQWETENTLEHIKKMYGGGDYQARTFRSNGQMYKMFNFSIDHRIKGQLDEQSIKAIAEDKGGNGVTHRLMDMIQRPSADSSGFRGADIIKMMDIASDRQSQSMTLMMTMMMKSQETLATVLAAALSASNNKQGIDPVLLEILKSKTERPPMADVVETMVALKAIMSPEKEPEEERDMLSKITKLIGNAGPIIGALTGQQAQVVQQQQPQAPQLPPGEQPTGGVIDRLPLAVRMGIGQLVKAASRGADVGLYADLIIDQIDESQFSILRSILTQPDWCTSMFGDESRVAHVRPWLEQLRSTLLEYASSDSSSEPIPGSPVLPERGPDRPGPDTSVPGSSPL